MKLTLCVLALLAVVSAKQFYDEKFDKINVSEIVDNSKLLRHYANCFLEKGPCSGLTRELREVVKDAMKTACDRCSPKQTQLIRIVISNMRSKEPALLNQIIDKFDPSKKLRGPFYNILGI